MVAFLRRRWPLVVLVAGLAALVGAVASLAQSTSYTSHAKLLFAPSASAALAPAVAPEDPVRALDTVVKLAQTSEVMRAAAPHAGTSADELARRVAVSGDANADIVTVTATASSAERAQVYANAVARGLVAWEQQRGAALLRGRIASLQRQLGQFAGRSSPGVAAAAATVRTSLAEARAELGSVRPDVTLVEPARLPGAASGPHALRSTLLALLAGLIVGLAAAALVERLDPRVRDPEALAAAYRAAVLAELPEAGRRGQRADFGRSGPLPRALRALRSNLTLLSPGGGPPPVVLVSSAVAGEGKTALTANLAQAFASGGASVLAVCANASAPALHRHFARQNRNGALHAGILDVLEGVATLAEAAVPARLLGSTDTGTVSLLANGRTALDPGSVFASPAFAALLDEARGAYDVVLLDGPAVLEGGDALVLATRADAVVLAARLGRLRTAESRQAEAALERAGVRPAGVVAVHAAERRSRQRTYVPGVLLRLARRGWASGTALLQARNVLPQQGKPGD